MPVRTKTLNNAGNMKTITMVSGPDILTISYSRADYTTNFERGLRETMSEEGYSHMLSKFLVTLIRKWDLVYVDPQDEERCLAIEAEILEKENREISVAELQEKGIRFITHDITIEVLDELVSTEMKSKLVEALAEQQNPDPKSSDFTSNT